MFGNQKGVRLSSGLVLIVAAAATTRLFTLGTVVPKRAVIRKVMWHNRSGGNTTLSIGYTTLGAVFTPVLPLIYMVNGLDGELDEWHLPVAGNTPQGFCPDTTLVTGTPGDIDAQAAAAGPAPAEVQVIIEVEVI